MEETGLVNLSLRKKCREYRLQRRKNHYYVQIPLKNVKLEHLPRFYVLTGIDPINGFSIEIRLHGSDPIIDNLFHISSKALQPINNLQDLWIKGRMSRSYYPEGAIAGTTEITKQRFLRKLGKIQILSPKAICQPITKTKF